MSGPLAQLRAAVEAASEDVAPNAARAAPTLERPKKAGFGDYSTNAAMLLAPAIGEPPRDVAGRLSDALTAHLGGALERVEVAGPGFLNLFLDDGWFVDALRSVLAAGDGWGGGGASGEAERIDVEFVSANPTGPMHVGHARNAAYGDALARILAFHGHEITREFYVNDYGTQVRKLAESLRARARGEEVAPDGYKGEYVIEWAAAISGAAEMDLDELGQTGVAHSLSLMKSSLHEFRVEIDLWFSEASLHPGPVAHAFDVLGAQGNTYRSEGALWARTSAFGDDKDRVLERSSGDHTYLASDIAYHQHKRERGFDRLIDVWGADHHGYLHRTKATYQALGGDPDRLELLIMQFVSLPEGKMSKRSGDFVTLEELVEEIGVDAARWYLLQRSHDTRIELDLDLARRQSADNPVYYVQYAGARIASVLAKAGGAGDGAFGERELPLDPAERALIKKLLVFGGEVAEAAERRAPHRIATYALELAQEFTAFYRDCRVVGAEGKGVEAFRLALGLASRRTIARSLDLLGVAAPEEM